MTRSRALTAGAVALVGIGGVLLGRHYVVWQRAETLRYQRGETELVVTDVTGRARVTLFKAGKRLDEAKHIAGFDGRRIWLPEGNYFVEAEESGRRLYYPAPLTGYRGGPDRDGAFVITIRPAPRESPPRLVADRPEFVYIPSGHFLLGDRANPREPHYVWLTAYFLAPFEVTNAEFREFLNDQRGYAPSDYRRFGQPDQPVTNVTWHEANAFCQWLTARIGAGRWMYSLPTDAEWEKAARGPDSLDYGLSRFISDEEVKLYNWRKNPDAPVTVVGWRDSVWGPNRYGLHHMSGNVWEWTRSVFRPYNRQQPFAEDDRSHDNIHAQRTARGGSWYSASIALLYLPYRDAFQPEHRSNDVGFRVAARLKP